MYKPRDTRIGARAEVRAKTEVRVQKTAEVRIGMSLLLVGALLTSSFLPAKEELLRVYTPAI